MVFRHTIASAAALRWPGTAPRICGPGGGISMVGISRLGHLALGSAAALALLTACGGAGLPSAPVAQTPQLERSSRSIRPPATQNWPQTYFNAGHIGYNAKETVLGTGNVSSLTLQWAQSVSGGVTGFALQNGVIYAQGQGGSQGAVLDALNAQTGAPKWNITTGNDGYGENGTVIVAKGMVFAGCSANLTNQQEGLCAYKASTGAMVWSFYDDCGCLPPAHLSAPPSYSNGVLYFAYDDGGGSSPNAIRAVDATTGTQIWADGGTNFGDNAPAAGSSLVYAACGAVTSDYVCAYNVSNGDLQWSTQVGDQANIAISLAGSVVYAASNLNGSNTSTVEALDAATGAAIWTFTYTKTSGGAVPAQPPAIARSTVFVSGTNGVLYALRKSNGRKIWSTSTASGHDYVRSAPSVANGVVYVIGGGSGGSGPNTSAYNAATGALLWTSPSTIGTLYAPPIVANGILYFASPGDATCSSICAYSLGGARSRGEVPGSKVRL
ncbi:MAG: PQQ-binding-like beta-propeller repeat protein [Candidatus Eremiobacteraeota bacterium]|nr:PQQ-binding-like beta-propeller repeat protein [Candidatus Eremiobacteraeota bacterium]